jgi:hypothetical protein
MRGNWLRLVRRFHLYLSVFFAPLLLLFVVTGWAQTVGIAREQTPTLMQKLSGIHKSQYFSTNAERASGRSRFGGYMEGLGRAHRAWPMKMLVVAMCVALIISIALGLVLAFATVRKRIPVWIALILGVATPVTFLALAHLN